MPDSVQIVRESHLRSISKAFSWRMVATLTTGGIAYGVTGEVDTAIMIGSIEFILKIFIYYVHERAWQALPRGAFVSVDRIRNRFKSKVSDSYNPP